MQSSEPADTPHGKVRLALPWAEMDELERFLADEFLIRQLPDQCDLAASIRATCGDRIADEYDDLNIMRATSSGRAKERVDKRFYDLISDQPLLGTVHSSKWPYILDAAAYLTALAAEYHLTGPFLDVGCHGGYHALWLATAMKMNGRGIDRCRPAIYFARRQANALGLSADNVSFTTGDISDNAPPAGYSMIYSSDGPLGIDRSALEKARRMLSADGLLVWIGAGGGLAAESIRAALAAARLSLVVGDVIGGWDGLNYGANLVLVMAHGDDPNVGDGIVADCESIWNSGFREYCNTAGRLASEKVLSKYRSWCTYGPRTRSE